LKNNSTNLFLFCFHHQFNLVRGQFWHQIVPTPYRSQLRSIELWSSLLSSTSITTEPTNDWWRWVYDLVKKGYVNLLSVIVISTVSYYNLNCYEQVGLEGVLPSLLNMTTNLCGLKFFIIWYYVHQDPQNKGVQFLFLYSFEKSLHSLLFTPAKYNRFISLDPLIYVGPISFQVEKWT
jgi:hypothetical protein